MRTPETKRPVDEKPKVKKLTLKKETLRQLTDSDLKAVGGATMDFTSASNNQGACCCFC